MKYRIQGMFMGMLLFIILLIPIMSFAQMKGIEVFCNDIKVSVNNKDIKTDSPIFVYNGRTYVPIRFIAEELNSEVSWNETKNTVEIKSFTKQSSDSKEPVIQFSNLLPITTPASVDVSTKSAISLLPENNPYNYNTSNTTTPQSIFNETSENNNSNSNNSTTSNSNNNITSNSTNNNTENSTNNTNISNSNSNNQTNNTNNNSSINNNSNNNTTTIIIPNLILPAQNSTENLKPIEYNFGNLQAEIQKLLNGK